MRFLECERHNLEMMINSNGVGPRYVLQFESNEKTGMKHQEQKYSVNIPTCSDFINYQRWLVLVRSA